MTDFTFVDDIPEDRRGRRVPRENVLAFADALRGNPNKWAVYPFFSENASESYRRSLMSAINKESRRAPVGLRSGFVGAFRSGNAYVRWLGDAKGKV